MAENLDDKFLFVSLMNKCSIMETKEIILRKTFGLLLHKGYTGVSVSDIQEATGMARGLLYHYFGSQDQLFDESIQTFLNQWLVFDKGSLKNQALSDLIVYVAGKYQEMSVGLQEEQPDGAVLADVRHLLCDICRRQMIVSDMVWQIDRDRYGVWKTAVLNSFLRGELKTGLNLESVARHFLYIEDGITLNSGKKPDGELIYDLEKGLREFYEIIKR